MARTSLYMPLPFVLARALARMDPKNLSAI
jgi:hypothetical protein